MGKVEINNEIVLLRKNVDQAKVHIIKKLLRDAFKLRTKKGTDEQKAKNLRKADRISHEIQEIKKIKQKDEITKYILTNELCLNEILKDSAFKPLPRIMARIANHKTFSKKITEFKTKYPNYMEFLGLGRKKKAKLEFKEKQKLKKEQKAGNVTTETNENNKVDKMKVEDQEDEFNDEFDIANDDSGEEDIDFESEEEEEDKKEKGDVEEEEEEEKEKEEDNDKENNGEEEKVTSEDENIKERNLVKNKKSLKIIEIKSVQNDKTKEKPKNLIKKGNNFVEEKHKKLLKKDDDSVKENPKKSTKKKNNQLAGVKLKKQETKKQKKIKLLIDDNLKYKNQKPKIISKMAIVKKFTDISTEVEKNEKNVEEVEEKGMHSVESRIQVEKEEDPFFMSGDGYSNYMSVALPKSNRDENEDEEYPNKFNKRKFSRQQNDDFFNKVPRNQDSKFNNRNEDTRFNNRNGDSRFNNRNGDSRFNSRNGDSRFNNRNGDHRNGDFKFNNRNGESRFNNRNGEFKYGERPNNKRHFENEQFSKFSKADIEKKPFKKNFKSDIKIKGNETLHPSWEAKKRQQDAIKQGFQGKKIVFGDDV